MRIRIRDKSIKVNFKSRLAKNIIGEITKSSPYIMDIKSNLKDKELFEVFLHEIIHSILPDWEEQSVDELSIDIAEAFYQVFDIDIKRKITTKQKRKHKKNKS
jgi:hypothetical protein